MVDVYGSTSVYENFWKCTACCKYRAECPVKKRLLVEAAKNGTTVKLEEVGFGLGEGDEKAFGNVSAQLPKTGPAAYCIYSKYKHEYR